MNLRQRLDDWFWKAVNGLPDECPPGEHEPHDNTGTCMRCGRQVDGPVLPNGRPVTAR